MTTSPQRAALWGPATALQPAPLPPPGTSHISLVVLSYTTIFASPRIVSTHEEPWILSSAPCPTIQGHEQENTQQTNQNRRSKMLAELPVIAYSDRLYFAYGSNLSPEQMARRCPDSIFLGKATLPGYRWQANERGIANVVMDPDPDADPEVMKKGREGRGRDGEEEKEPAAVEGLLYALSLDDEIRLDRYEGVAKGRYDKFAMEVCFEPVRGNVFARCTSASVATAIREEQRREEARGRGTASPGGTPGVERRARSWGEEDGEERRRRRDSRPDDSHRRRAASVGRIPSSFFSSSFSSAAKGGRWRDSILGFLGIPSKARRAPSSPLPPSPQPGRRGREGVVGAKWVKAIAYISFDYMRDGMVKAQHVPRMRRAIADALSLGVSRGYVEGYMAPRMPLARGEDGEDGKDSEDGPEEDKGRREEEGAQRRRSINQSEGSGRYGRRDSVVEDRHGDR